MKSKAQELWENSKTFALIEGVVFNNKIIELDFIKCKDNDNLSKSIVIRETTIEEVLREYPGPYTKTHSDRTIAKRPNPNNILEMGTGIGIYPSAPIIFEGNKIYFGEGQMGNEGFVACTDNDNQFIWSIHFDCNPIISASFESNDLYLVSNNTSKVKINLKELTKIEIDEVQYI